VTGQLPREGMCCLVLEEGSRAVRLAPTAEPAAAVNLEYLALALQVRLQEGREPFFSLDPVDPTDRNSMQEKRFEPAWLAGTSVGDVLFQADYRLKELSMGESQQPIVGMKSCFDFSEEEGHCQDWNAREWFVVNSAEVQLSEDCVLIPSVKMGIEAREQLICAGRLEDARVTRPDHPLVKYAKVFTDKFDLIAERTSVVYHLRELAKASVLAKFLLDTGVQLEEAWFQHAGAQSDACCLEIPQLWNERYRSQIQVKNGKVLDAGKACRRSVNGVYGGVEFGLDKFDLAEPRTWRLRTAIAPAAPLVGARLPPPRGVSAAVLTTTLARATRAVPTAAGVPAAAAALAVPRFSKRVKGVGAARGVDLNLDKFDLSSPEQVASQALQSEGLCGSLGTAFWTAVDGDLNPVFKDQDRSLLRDIFNPQLSDRREEGDRFIPPDTNSSYVEELRSLVKREAVVRQARRDYFLSDKFVVGDTGPLFPSSWTSPSEVPRSGPLSQGCRLQARPDYQAAAPVFEQALKSMAPAFDRRTEDGMKFRIYRVGSVEVRTTQEHDGKEVVGVLFSVRTPQQSEAARGKVQELEQVVKATEFVERAVGQLLAREDAQPLDRSSYVVLETSSGNAILTQMLRDGTVAWEENPADLEDRNSLARVIRSADCSGSSITVGDMRGKRASEAAAPRSAACASECKRYAQGVYSLASGSTHVDSGFRQQPGSGKWRLSLEGEGGWHGAKAQRYSKQAIRVRCDSRQA